MKLGWKIAAWGCGGTLVLGLTCTAVFGAWGVKEAREQQAALAAREKALAEKREADFKAMTPDQHLKAAQDMVGAGNLVPARAHARALPEDDPRRAQVLQQIEAASKKQLAAAAAKGAEDSKAVRRAYAKALESRYLDMGMNVDVTTEGKEADVLRVKWALVSKVTAHQFQKGDLIEEVRNLGFKKFILTNGFQSDMGETWTWDLTKPK